LAHGHTHLFLMESRRLYQEALKQLTPEDAHRNFQNGFDKVNSYILKHNEMKPETHNNSEPISQFHQYSRDFCIKHQLYLTPTTFVGKNNELVF
ncbi:MAG: hypothetical protein PHF57_10620, partial [Methanoregula sp.]|nr:hypothetical protein [Methanoregula sp.]